MLFRVKIRAHVALEGDITVFISSMLSQKLRRGKCIGTATTRQYRVSIGVDGLMNQKCVLTVISLLIKDEYSWFNLQVVLSLNYLRSIILTITRSIFSSMYTRMTWIQHTKTTANNLWVQACWGFSISFSFGFKGNDVMACVNCGQRVVLSSAHKIVEIVCEMNYRTSFWLIF